MILHLLYNYLLINLIDSFTMGGWRVYPVELGLAQQEKKGEGTLPTSHNNVYK